MSNRCTLWVVVSVCLLLGASNLFAAEKKGVLVDAHDEVTGQGYGAAGCGLGSIAFGKKKGMVQVLAATTNGTSGTQTFGISSGTSNCKPDSGNRAANLNVFVEGNRLALANDVARGNGETLVSLSHILGCQKEATLGAALQNNYTKIFSGENVDSGTISESILTTVQESKTLASTCSISS